jgi:hypothetical protein
MFAPREGSRQQPGNLDSPLEKLAARLAVRAIRLGIQPARAEAATRSYLADCALDLVHQRGLADERERVARQARTYALREACRRVVRAYHPSLDVFADDAIFGLEDEAVLRRCTLEAPRVSDLQVVAILLGDADLSSLDAQGLAWLAEEARLLRT